MILPREWSDEELGIASRAAIEHFRQRRIQESLEDYFEAFDAALGHCEDLFEATVDLTQLGAAIEEVLGVPGQFDALRHMTAPPISVDDLKTLVDARSFTRATRGQDAMLARSIAETVTLGLDRRRLPWLFEDREPTDSERRAAILASSALLAVQRVATKRRGDEKKAQENRVEAALTDRGLGIEPPRPIVTLADAPPPGAFCRECMLGSRKADFVVRLYDRRVLALECKVSNSATNSVKRLNNDAAVKAVTWREEFGRTQVVPAAVLSGVYKLINLRQAQGKGLAIFWAHDLERMLDFIEDTKR